MTWILWVTFSFATFPPITYPLEIYPRQWDCEMMAKASQVEYEDLAKALFGKDAVNVHVSTACIGTARV